MAAVRLLGLCGLATLLPGSPLILRTTVYLYAWLAGIAVIGATLHVNRNNLSESIPLIIPELSSPGLGDLARERERWIDSMYGALRANNRDHVWQLAMERIATVPHPLSELQWLYGRAAGWRPLPFPNRVAQEVISRLLGAEREGEALRWVRERLALDASFRPLQNEETRRLTLIAERWHDVATAEALKKSFVAAA